ncbi:MAG: hypothetical protein QM711_04940 [Micropruina sp.]|uniref:CdaR family protein n=1 Tax=Micropruina sp. TaxID=2737536 RepID=UPI0039E4E917
MEEMESVISRFFLHNWQRKVVGLLTAIIIWLFVNHSINATKTIANVPIRIINLPSDKTISGLLPNGMLTRRIALTVTGTMNVVEDLEAGDLEVLLDASLADSDEWIVQITKKNLVSLNPSIDLRHHITQLEPTDLVIKLSRLITAKIPLTIETPTGNPPQGYEYLDIWPQVLTQTLSGPEDDVQKLKEQGLHLTFDLRDITKAELDAIKSNLHNDEISFPIPKKWKRVSIPFQNNNFEDLNDPESQNLRIDFLRKEFLPLGKEIPIRVFYPLAELDKINPETYALETNDDIVKVDGTYIFKKPLYAREVSRLFIEVIRDSIEIVIVASPKNERNILVWSIEYINPRGLEDTYVAFSITNSLTNKGNQVSGIPKKKEELLRRRFREYMRRMMLYLTETRKLHIKGSLEGDQIKVTAY